MSNKKKVTSKVTGVVAGATVGTLLAFASGVPAFAAATDPVNFADQNFKNCVAEALNVTPNSVITEGQMSGLRDLSCSDFDNGITNISGAEFLTSVTSLSLRNSEVSDLKPIENLNQLTSLDVSDTNVKDLSSISKLPNLITLFLVSTDVVSLSGAENLTNLKWLVTGESDISDLSPLTNIPLSHLLVYGNTNIADLSPLANKTTLTNLVIEKGKVSDLSPLATATGLKIVDLSGNDLDNTDLAALSQIPGLEEISLYDSNVSDLTSLSRLASLKRLNLGNTASVNGVPVQGNKITDLSPIANLTNLISLDVRGNNIKNVAPLSGLTNLEWLYLNNNEITDLSPLVRLSEITQFDATGQRWAATTPVETGTAVPFRVTAVDNSNPSPTITPSNAGYYDRTNGSIVFTEPGTTKFNWSVPVALGSALGTFSGSGSQVVEGETILSPDAPTNVVAVPGNNPGEVNISWDAVTNTNGTGTVESYLVEYRQVGSATWTNRTNTPDTKNIIYSGITAGNSYEFRVAAISSTGVQGNFSSTVTAIAAEDEETVTAAPVTGIVVSDVTHNKATVTWNPVTDTNGNGTVSEYTVAISQGNSGNGVTVPANVTSIPLTVNPESTYNIVVTYTTSTGATGSSEVVSFTTLEAPEATEAPAITELTSTAGKARGSIDLNWRAVNDTVEGTGGNGDVVNYNIRYRAVGAKEWIAVGKYVADGNTNSGSLVNLAAGEFEIAISYTTDTGVTSPEAFTTATVTNGLANGATGNGDGNTAGNGNTDDVKPSASVSKVTPTGSDSSPLLGGLAALSLLGGAGIFGVNHMRKRKQQTAN